MKSIKLVLALLVGTLTLNSCMEGGEPTPQEPAGTLVFVNGYTPAEGVTYHLDQNSIGSLRYAEVNYLNNIAVGKRNLSATSTNNAPIENVDITVEDMEVYSTFLFGTSEEPKFYAIEETTEGLEELNGRSAIRFIHLANGLEEEVDFFIGDEKIEELSERVQETEESLVQHKTFTIASEGNSTVDLWIKDKEGNKLDSLKNFQLGSNHVVSLHWVGIHEDEEQPLKIIPFRIY